MRCSICWRAETFLERTVLMPRLAKLVIRCDDIETQARIEHAIARELHIQ